METTLTPDSIDRFRSSLFARGRSENTQKAYTTDLLMFLRWSETVANTTPDSMTFDHLATEWLNSYRMEIAPKTTNRRLTTLRTFARWAKWTTDDLDEYKAPNPGKPEPHPIPEGIPGVLAMCQVARTPEQRALVALCGLCGLRVAEALSVTVGSFNTARDSRSVRVRGKGDVTRTVPVSDQAWLEIAEAVAAAVLRAGDSAMAKNAYVIRYRDRFARQIITNLAKKAKLSRLVSSHDLRATFATAVYNKTLDLRTTQELLGHSSSKTTEGYTEVTNDKKRNAVNFRPDENKEAS